MFSKWLLFLLTVVWFVPGYAESSSSACNALGSYKDVLRCAMENHPEIEQAKLLLNQNKNLVDMAEQRPNPELSSQILSGKAGDDSYQYNQINLAHTFELGGKRDARIRRSQGQISSTEIDFQMTQEKVYLHTYMALVRLRQIKSELEIYDDALSTFERIQKQYRGRPRMTPEQQATYSIMDIAASDYRLRRRPLVNEVRENERFLDRALGRKFNIGKDFYPPLRTKWPTLKVAKNSISSLNLKKSLADLELAESELSEAKSLSWPDFKIGPTFEAQSQGSQRTNSFGLNLSFAIPLYHANGAGRSFAASGVSRANQIVNTTKNFEAQQIELQQEKYRDAVEALEGTLSINDLHNKHRTIEKSFSSGVIPSALIIEIHRQMADYSKSLSEQESTAIEALARIYSIEGRLLTEGL